MYTLGRAASGGNGLWVEPEENSDRNEKNITHSS